MTRAYSKNYRVSVTGSLAECIVITKTKYLMHPIRADLIILITDLLPTLRLCLFAMIIIRGDNFGFWIVFVLYMCQFHVLQLFDKNE